jgi:hypothetical protein
VRTVSAAAVPIVLAVALSACSGGTVGGRPTQTLPSGPPTAIATTGTLTPYCAQLATAATHIAAAESELYQGSSGSAVRTLQTELAALQVNAPPALKAALADLSNGFVLAQQLLAHPTQQNEAQLVAAEARLAADSQLISTYAVANCPAH